MRRGSVAKFLFLLLTFDRLFGGALIPGIMGFCLFMEKPSVNEINTGDDERGKKKRSKDAGWIGDKRVNKSDDGKY